MDIAQQKEQFSFAYLRAVAAVAGYALYRPEVDDDSVDWGLAARGEAGTPRRPRCEVQLKCTARDLLDADRIRFPLKRKNYDDLRDADVLVPRVLVVVLVPPSLTDWLRQTEEELAMRHAAYWLSLRDHPDVPNEETVTVYLSRAQQLTPPRSSRS